MNVLICTLLCRNLKKMHRVSYSFADLILSHCVELGFLEGMLDRCLMLTFLKWSVFNFFTFCLLQFLTRFLDIITRNPSSLPSKKAVLHNDLHIDILESICRLVHLFQNSAKYFYLLLHFFKSRFQIYRFSNTMFLHFSIILFF